MDRLLGEYGKVEDAAAVASSGSSNSADDPPTFTRSCLCDQLNRLTSVTRVARAHDAAGSPASTTSRSTTTQFLYDKANMIARLRWIRASLRRLFR